MIRQQVGAKNHKQLDKVSAIDASIKRSDHVRSLDHLHPGIELDKNLIKTDCYCTERGRHGSILQP